MADVAAWFPQGTTDEERDAYLAEYPDDPHRAAAQAWYDYAATMDPDASPAEVQSVSTGAQTVTYSSSGSPFAAATARGDWHLTRSKGKSVRMGSTRQVLTFGDIRDEVDDLSDTDEDEDRGTIETAYFPPIGG